MQSWLTPIRILLLYLVVLAVAGSLSWGGVNPLFWLTQGVNFGLLFGGSWLTYLLLVKVKLGRPTRWEHHLITSLILFLLFDPEIPWFVFLGLGIITELIQRLIRVPTGPLLNPAATGAVVATLFGFFPAWWGVSFAPRLPLFEGGMSVAALFTIPIAGYVAHTYKKLPIVAMMLGSFVAAYILILQMSPVFVLFEGTLAFFLLVMAIEPKTSPVMRAQQLAYGAVLGLLTVLSIKFGWLEPYCVALLIVNVLFNLYKNHKILLMKWRRPAAPAVNVSPGITPPVPPTP